MRAKKKKEKRWEQWGASVAPSHTSGVRNPPPEAACLPAGCPGERELYKHICIIYIYIYIYVYIIKSFCNI